MSYQPSMEPTQARSPVQQLAETLERVNKVLTAESDRLGYRDVLQMVSRSLGWPARDERGEWFAPSSMRSGIAGLVGAVAQGAMRFAAEENERKEREAKAQYEDSRRKYNPDRHEEPTRLNPELRDLADDKRRERQQQPRAAGASQVLQSVQSTQEQTRAGDAHRGPSSDLNVTQIRDAVRQPGFSPLERERVNLAVSTQQGLLTPDERDALKEEKEKETRISARKLLA
ncbi:MAG: hypothetical protein KDD69_16855 [Bdellovibrionales bacterium]|nr:hypothetical protein [Bdellovibrionales bacterium]